MHLHLVNIYIAEYSANMQMNEVMRMIGRRREKRGRAGRGRCKSALHCGPASLRGGNISSTGVGKVQF